MISKCAALVAVSACVLLGAGCDGAQQAVQTDPAAYRGDLGDICTAATLASEAVPQPVGNDDVATFASQIADAIDGEADRARDLTAPDDLDADHRAFVRNTGEQADLWRELASVDPEDAAAFGALRTKILELTLGRDDLAESMGVPACVRSNS